MRRWKRAGLCVPFMAMLMGGAAAGAQQPAAMPRIGVLRMTPAEDPFFQAFRQALRDLGYIEGQNILIEYRSAEGDPGKLPALAAELVQMKVDVLMPGGNTAARAAKQATSTIPIVMSVVTSPVESGLVTSLSKPGGNITGMATLLSELSAKRLELLKEAFPKVTRVAAIYDPSTDPIQVRETESAARVLGVRLQLLEVRGAAEFDGAFASAKKARAGALSVLASAMFNAHKARIVTLATTSRLPAIYEHREFVHVGGLMSYGPNLRDLYRRAASYVDKILKGAKPADLPVEQPTRFELVINLATARALGLTFPQIILIRADHVIQ